MALHLPHITHNTGAIYSVHNFKYNNSQRPDKALLKTWWKLVCAWKYFLFMRTLENLVLLIDAENVVQGHHVKQWAAMWKILKTAMVHFIIKQDLSYLSMGLTYMRCISLQNLFTISSTRVFKWPSMSITFNSHCSPQLYTIFLWMVDKFALNFDFIYCINTTLHRGMWHIHMTVITCVTLPFVIQVHHGKCENS